MCLDVGERIMAVERTFDFQIPDAEAGKLRTVGDLHRYIRENVAAAPEDPELLPNSPRDSSLSLPDLRSSRRR
jgi:hypothetical protein